MDHHGYCNAYGVVVVVVVVVVKGGGVKENTHPCRRLHLKMEGIIIGQLGSFFLRIMSLVDLYIRMTDDSYRWQNGYLN